MRFIQVNHTLEYNNLRHYYIGVREIVSRYRVHRATAYRYLQRIPAETKIKVRIGEGRPFTMGQIVAVDRIHAQAKPGNPHMDAEHQKKAARSRWPSCSCPTATNKLDK